MHETEETAQEDFFAGLVRRIVELVTPAPPPEELPADSALTSALLRGLLAMKLTGDPVESVVEAKRGRPVRYEAGSKTLFVNAAHATVLALEAHPSRLLLLLSAAVSEVNRELVDVTDAEELAVIVVLLRDG